MRIVLQRVSSASVSIDDHKIAAIDSGFLLLVGVEDSDGQAEVEYLTKKISKLRVFEDEKGKMNLALKDVSGKILSVSQFTLYADTKKGNRPGFSNAGKPDHAKKIYEDFNSSLEKEGIEVKTGQFGADMQVQLINDGPVTIIYDTDQL